MKKFLKKEIAFLVCCILCSTFCFANTKPYQQTERFMEALLRVLTTVHPSDNDLYEVFEELSREYLETLDTIEHAEDVESDISSAESENDTETVADDFVIPEYEPSPWEPLQWPKTTFALESGIGIGKNNDALIHVGLEAFHLGDRFLRWNGLQLQTGLVIDSSGINRIFTGAGTGISIGHKFNKLDLSAGLNATVGPFFLMTNTDSIPIGPVLQTFCQLSGPSNGCISYLKIGIISMPDFPDNFDTLPDDQAFDSADYCFISLGISF